MCPCCGQFHRLKKCWYAFPEQAPDGFVEREHLRMRSKEALLDSKLQEQVEKLKRKKDVSQSESIPEQCVWLLNCPAENFILPYSAKLIVRVK